MRIIVFWGLYWGSLILGNYHMLSKTPSSACSYMPLRGNVEPLTVRSEFPMAEWRRYHGAHNVVFAFGGPGLGAWAYSSKFVVALGN